MTVQLGFANLVLDALHESEVADRIHMVDTCGHMWYLKLGVLKLYSGEFHTVHKTGKADFKNI